MRCFFRMIKWDEILISGFFPSYMYILNMIIHHHIHIQHPLAECLHNTLLNNTKCTAYTVWISRPACNHNIQIKYYIILYTSAKFQYKARIIMQIICKYKPSADGLLLYILANLYYGNGLNKFDTLHS